MSAARGERTRGSVAILVLWGLALIFMLLAPVAFATRGEVKIAGNALAASRARLAAEAGTQLGLSRLLRRHDKTGFDGTPQPWQQGSTRVRIAIADEAGKIDLNVAPLELLAGLFAAAGEPPEAAALVACNVLDRRGDVGTGCPDAVPHQGRRFAVPEELAEVPGVGERLFDAVADSVTVASGASAIDPLVAPRLALLAIPGATADLVDDFLRSRATMRDLASIGAGMIPPGMSGFLMASPGRDFTISAIALAADGARYRADLQIRLTERAAQPYQVVAWRAPPVDRGTQRPPIARRVP